MEGLLEVHMTHSMKVVVVVVVARAQDDDAGAAVSSDAAVVVGCCRFIREAFAAAAGPPPIPDVRILVVCAARTAWNRHRLRFRRLFSERCL